ncbi:family 43 glycosylhydrolase [Nocardioides sp. zg-536]|uniref:Family 43 glycosylhydrolase n=1 Tax=Nocardioides faecalis TaxID=2803858 RepID=A0A938YB11_9ACTN|nr:glycoside hydrolase family 43 protein [Nocardioides faecalis]MBM9460716.1 family 43 glycosylhydrolase [Nocardioides faecalis]QVI57919.1 family 43 glycosylhydrolase [Nocardioides faecalis]
MGRRRGLRWPAALLVFLVVLPACTAGGQQPPGSPSQQTTDTISGAPLIPEPTTLPSELPPSVPVGEMQDLAQQAERLAQELPAQRRPTPIRQAPGGTRWQAGQPYRGYFADPDLVRHGGRWYAYATNTSHLRLPTLTSTDLRTWTPLTDAAGGVLDPLQPAAWVVSRRGGQSLWAPGVAKVGDGWTAAYSAPAGTDGGERHNCIGLSRGPSPAGPFRAVGERICYGQAQLGVIDPDIYIDPTGVPWLLWKFSGVVNRRPAGIFVRQLSPEGTGFAKGSQTRELLTLSEPWEGDTIENPSMIEFRGVTYLFYSANSWEDERYATGYAICAGPTGPCVRQNNGDPLLSTAAIGRLGPGGGTAFVHRKSLRMLYHAWDRVGNQRQLHVAGFWQREDGTLEVVDPG